MILDSFIDSSRPDPSRVANFAESSVTCGNRATGVVSTSLPYYKSLMFHQKPRRKGHRISPPPHYC
jgi:hypothetical protein